MLTRRTFLKLLASLPFASKLLPAPQPKFVGIAPTVPQAKAFAWTPGGGVMTFSFDQCVAGLGAGDAVYWDGQNVTPFPWKSLPHRSPNNLPLGRVVAVNPHIQAIAVAVDNSDPLA